MSDNAKVALFVTIAEWIGFFSGVGCVLGLLYLSGQWPF